MRKLNSISEIKLERDDALLDTYRRLMLAGSPKSALISDLSRAIVSEPSPRFWVSEERASIVISLLARGIVPPAMSDAKSRMFAEIFSRVRALRATTPRLSMAAAVRRVINSPAPEFYLSPRYAMSLIRSLRASTHNPKSTNTRRPRR